MLESGEYHVFEIRGKMECPDFAKMEAMRTLPRVQTWSVLSPGRVQITRTDVPEAFEEWEFFYVQRQFTFFGILFSAGDLVAYMRRAPGNQNNVATTFRHFQSLH